MDDFESVRNPNPSKTNPPLDPFKCDPEGEKWKEINCSSGTSGFSEDTKNSPMYDGDNFKSGFIQCKCYGCPEMQNSEDQKCCWAVKSWQKNYSTDGVLCLLDLKNFKNIFNRDNHRMLLNVYNSFLRDDDQGKPINSRLRYSAYRGAIAFLYDKLGKHVRTPVPSCVVKAIRELYPGDVYTGFKVAEQEANVSNKREHPKGHIAIKMRKLEFNFSDEMEQEFGQGGSVTDAYNTGKGYAFITKSSPSEAQAAVSQIDNTEVDVAKLKEGGSGEDGGGGCFKCGEDGHNLYECPYGGGNGCFKCGGDGHKSYECPEDGGGGGNRW